MIQKAPRMAHNTSHLRECRPYRLKEGVAMHHLVYLIPYSFFEACEKTSTGSWVTRTGSLFGAIETAHIMGLAVLLGALLVIDMRLLGIGIGLGSPAEL